MMGMRDSSPAQDAIRRKWASSSRARVVVTQAGGTFSPKALISAIDQALPPISLFLWIMERPYYKQYCSAISNHKIRFFERFCERRPSRSVEVPPGTRPKH